MQKQKVSCLIELTDYIFDESGLELEDSVRLETAGPVQDHGAVKISAWGIEKTIKLFSFITCRGVAGAHQARSPGNALLSGFIRSNQVEHWILLLGTLKAILIDVAAETVYEPLLLFRSIEDDQGFYSSQVHLAGDCVVIEYEGGIFLISQSRIVWHQEKLWDHSVQSIDTQTIYLMGDSRGESEASQRIDLQTGKLNCG